MMSMPEPFLAAEIDYRRERIAQSFAGTSRRHARRSERRRPSLRTARRPRRNVVTLSD